MRSFLSEIISDFLSLIYPAFCLGCDRTLLKGEELLCSHCISDLPKTNYHHWKDNPMVLKFRGRLPIRTAVAFLKFKKRGMVQRMLHSFKYKNYPQLGIKLGYLYGTELKAVNMNLEYDCIVAVPLHISRYRQRGYNQSEKWAEGLSEGIGLPILVNKIERITRTKTQTKRTKLNRWENVKEVFHVKNGKDFEGKSVLLVDDVVTTGATLEACAQTLLSNGCKEVGIVCMAVA